MTSESMRPRASAPQQEKPLQQEACTLQLEHSPCLPQREEGPHTGAKTQHSQKFKNEVYSFVALSTVMFLCNHPNIHSQNSFHFAKTEILSPFAPPPIPGNHYSTVCLYESDCCRFLTEAELHSICPLITGLFHLASRP